jgi:hypothetical protein
VTGFVDSEDEGSTIKLSEDANTKRKKEKKERVQHVLVGIHELE